MDKKRLREIQEHGFSPTKLEKYLNEEYEDSIEKLSYSIDWDNVRYTQGYLACIKELLEIFKK